MPPTDISESITEMQRQKNTLKSGYLTDVKTVKELTQIRKCSTRNQQIQANMTYRALELLNLPPDQPAYLLDIGCGSGLSGEILDEEGYIWTGVDIAPSMLGAFRVVTAHVTR